MWTALSQGPDPVLALDADGIVRRLSRPIGGIKPGDLHGRPLAEHVQEGTLPEPGEAGNVRIGKDAGRWWRIARVAATDGSVVVCTDIDGTTRELKHLRASQRLMRDTEGMSHLGIWTWDITEPHARWTNELYRIYGLDPETHTPTYEDYLTRVHPDDVERVQAATEACFQDHRPYSHDERIRHSSGQWRWLHTWARPILDDEGQLQALHGVCMDVTDRKNAEEAQRQSEERLQAIMDNAGLGIATVDGKGHVRDANPAFDELLDHIPGTPIWHAMPLDVGNHARNAIKAVLDGRGGRHVETFQVNDSWIRLILTRVAAEPPFVVALAQDVSAEHAAKEARNRIDELEAQHSEHVRMVGVAGHEMKNPLTPVTIQLNLLASGRLGDLSEPQENAVQRIQAQVERLSGMLHELMDASNAGSGRMRLQRTPCDLAPTIIDAVATHQPAAEDFHVHLSCEVDDAIDAEADAARVAQAVDNLVANALRFTPAGGHVSVHAGRDGDDVVIRVTDDGTGIPEEQQERLFEAFARGESPAQHPGSSTGLGLYIVKGIVEGHGGRVTARSKPGDTEFTLRFPAKA